MSVTAAADALLLVSERLRGQPTPAALAGECKKVLAELGSYHFAAGMFAPSRPEDRSIMAIDYPAEWIDHYFEQNYIDIDTTITTAASRLAPYDWSFDYDPGTDVGRLFRDVHDIGVRDGFTVPVHGPTDSIFVTSFATRDTRLMPRDRLILQWLGSHLAQQYELSTHRPLADRHRITNRERDILTWIARGKTSWCVGEIIGISENTVNTHLRRALAKLQVNGRTMGVVKAITLGIIQP